jgi:hypothetical protein
MGKLMGIDVYSGHISGRGRAGVSLAFTAELSGSVESLGESLCERLSRLDSELEKVRADIGTRGEPEIASLIETTGGGQ